MRAVQCVAPSLSFVVCLSCSPSRSAAAGSQPVAEASRPIGAPAAEGPGLPAPEVWLTPVDLTTGTGAEVVPRVTIMNSGMPLGATLEPLIRNISLRSWPGLVPVDAELHIAEPSGSNAGEPSTIDVVPAQPLVDGWYVLAVTDLPPPFSWPRFQPIVTDARIGSVSRFRTASSPFVASVRACAKEQGKMEWIVDYSELVAPDIAHAMRADQGGVPCERGVVANGRFVGAFTSVCGLSAGVRAPVTIQANSGFVSTSGARAAPFSVSLFADGMEPAGPGCTIARMPPPE